MWGRRPRRGLNRRRRPAARPHLPHCKSAAWTLVAALGRAGAGPYPGLRPRACGVEDPVEVGGEREWLKASPQSPSSWVAQKASAVASSPKRISRDACRARAMRPTIRRARVSMPSRSASSSRVEAAKASRRESVPAAAPTSAKKRPRPRALVDHRPQDVERLHVARALPDREQRALAVQARHPGLLDVAVAPENTRAPRRCGSGRACRRST